MKVAVFIPSRLASTRLPNKPLADIHGKPMICHVIDRAREAQVGEVVVAAGDVEIVRTVEAYGAKAVLTDPQLPSGSDRIWAGVQQMMQQGMQKPDIIINVQGDEPLLPPELLHKALQPFVQYSWVDVVTFAHPISEPEELQNPAMVKVVTTAEGRALYFSRCSIPHGAAQMKRHIGFYAYRYEALEQFVNTPPSPLEQQEKLEQLRGLEMGLGYYVGLVEAAPIGVDTPEDLAKVRQLLA